MKKMAMLALMLSVCLLSCCPTLAIDDKSVKNVDASTIIDYQYVMPLYDDDDIVGSLEDAIQENSTTNPDDLTAIGFIFSMTANNLGPNYLLHTTGSKYFYQSSLSYGNLRILGQLTDTSGQHFEVKVGGCWYNPTSNLFIADNSTYQYVYTGGSVWITIPKSYFHAEQMYRGFIKHFESAGEVSGTISFYNYGGANS